MRCRLLVFPASKSGSQEVPIVLAKRDKGERTVAHSNAQPSRSLVMGGLSQQTVQILWSDPLRGSRGILCIAADGLHQDLLVSPEHGLHQTRHSTSEHSEVQSH